MIGIAFVVRRTSDMAGLSDEVLYLRSRRRGDAGASMRRHLKAYHAAVYGEIKLAARASRLAEQAGEKTGIKALEQVEAQLAASIDQAAADNAAAIEHAEEIARLALIENYGGRTEEVLDRLTDRELHGVVSTIELGQMPKDFFGSPDTQPKPSATGPSGSSPAKRS